MNEAPVSAGSSPSVGIPSASDDGRVVRGANGIRDYLNSLIVDVGSKLSRAAVYRMIDSGSIPVKRLGGKRSEVWARCADLDALFSIETAMKSLAKAVYPEGGIPPAYRLETVTTPPIPPHPFSIARAERRSLTDAALQIVEDMGFGPREFIAGIGRIRNLLRVGLLPARKTKRGQATPVTPGEHRRLTWATLLTTCDIPPSVVARALEKLSDNELSGDVLTVELDSRFHDHKIKILASWPRNESKGEQ